jgi:hypothetical protein
LSNTIDNDADEHLNIAFNSMDQGLIVVRADLTVPILNVRATELADCPRGFADTRPNFREILAYQVESGAISQAYMDSSINDFILRGDELVETHSYTRKTASGRWLDVRTTPLPDGGFLRTFAAQCPAGQRMLLNPLVQRRKPNARHSNLMKPVAVSARL